MKHLKLIIAREYLERVRRKSFIVSTLLTPLFMLALMCAPAAVMYFSGPESKRVAVVDNSGLVATELVSDGEIEFINVDGNVEKIKDNPDYDAVLILDDDVLEDPSHIAYFTHGSPSMQTEQFITHQISSALSKQRLKSYDIDNLEQILKDVDVHASMRTYRLDSDDVEETSATTSYLIGMVTMMMLYMFILLYGNMVLTSIIEEKNNRVLEVVVSSTSPTQLLIGKILGIGLVAVTQIVIWGAIVIAFSMWGLPVLVNSMLTGSPDDANLAEMLMTVFSSGAMFKLFVMMVLFLLGGFIFYSSIYAAIGASVDNMQDATQLQSLAMVPIILGLIVSMSVAADPTSTVSVWGSIIPFTSPMVMMARLPFGVPGWQIAVSLVVLYLSTLGMVWLSAKIYRIGIFMYGKKPTVRDLIRWARYK